MQQRQVYLRIYHHRRFKITIRSLDLGSPPRVWKQQSEYDQEKEKFKVEGWLEGAYPIDLLEVIIEAKYTDDYKDPNPIVFYDVAHNLHAIGDHENKLIKLVA